MSVAVAVDLFRRTGYLCLRCMQVPDRIFRAHIVGVFIDHGLAGLGGWSEERFGKRPIRILMEHVAFAGCYV